jgi:hypothetical protein
MFTIKREKVQRRSSSTILEVKVKRLWEDLRPWLLLPSQELNM